jgi:hypothetical protein
VAIGPRRPAVTSSAKQKAAGGGHSELLGGGQRDYFVSVLSKVEAHVAAVMNGSVVAKLAAQCRAEWMICMPLGHG